MKTLFSELKVGNLIWDFDEHSFYPIEEIKKNAQGNMCIVYRNGSFMETDPVPMKLTEELLLKFRFEVYKSDHKESQYRYKGRLIVVIGNEFYDYGTSVKIEYVHRLQNLYFELGKELKTINK